MKNMKSFITRSLIAIVILIAPFFVIDNVFAQAEWANSDGDIYYNLEDEPTSGTVSPAGSNARPTSGTESPAGSTVRPTAGTESPAGSSGGSIGLKNPLKVKTIGGLIQSAVEIFSYLVIIFAVLAFIWVGLQYILARGNSDRMKELSKWLGYIAICVAVVIGARIIISIVINTLESTGTVDPKVIQSANDALDGR